MKFIEIERSEQKSNWNMRDLHSHSHYEIYYLYKGSRTFLLSNAIYVLNAPVMVVIPPYTMHKTEGGPFERYNVNVSADYLNDFEREVLDGIALRRVTPTDQSSRVLLGLLREMAMIDKKQPRSEYEVNALFSYFVYHLSKNESKGSEIPDENKASPLVLRIINYFNESYGERITLEDLSREFFASKATLIYHFKKYTNCSPIDFLLNVRINKAKEQLVNSKKSIELIAHDCGFSSANYFGLIFKKKEGISPANYRKYQKSKA